MPSSDRHPSSREAPRRESASLQSAIRNCRRAFAYVALFSLGVNVLMLASPLFMMQVYDRVLSTRHLDTLVVLALIAILAILTMGVLDAVRNFIVIRLGAWLDEQLAPAVLAGAVSEALRAAGGASAQGLRDLTSLRSFLSGPALFPLFDAPWAPVFLAVVFFIHPALGWIAVCGAAVLLVLALGNELATRRSYRAASAESLRALNEADSAVRNADAIAAMGLLGDLVRHWSEKSAPAIRHQRIASDRAALIAATARFMRIVLQIALLSGGALLVISDQITAGGMIAASVIITRAVAPMEQGIATWRNLVSAYGAYRRVAALVERAPAEARATSLPRPKGELAADRLAFFPPRGREPILRGVSFALAPGESLGLIGPSGSGKSTLARLLVGSLLPSGGSARLDGADLSAWDARDRGQYIGYLPQTVELFDGTVRENIARFQDCADGDVIAAAQLAGAHELIVGLPEAYETRIGNGGIPLSGGQRQRVGLARALFRSPALVVLDEPNANLDAAGEQALSEAIMRLRESGTTLVLITQRPGILGVVDKVLLLHGGSVEAFGAREHVLAKLRPPQPMGPREVARAIR